MAFAAFIGLANVAMAQESGPATPVATAEDYAAAVDHAIDAYIVPAYQRLEAQAGDLSAAVDGFCAKPGDETRAATEAAFDATIADWAGVDFFRFGPMARDARYERFAYWPDVHGTGARQLRRFLADENPDLLKPGALAGQSAAVQGLPALERLLYTGSKGLMNAAAPDAYRCKLAMAVAGNMHAIAKAALDGWGGEDGWAALMRNPGTDNPVYLTSEEAATEVLKAILTGLEQLRDQRIKPAIGDTPEEARASRAPYARSGQSLAYFLASASAIQAFADASGLVSLLPQGEAWVAGSADFEFSNLKGAIAAAGGDLEAALADTEKRQKLAYAEIVLESLRDLYQRQLGPAAGLTQGFNSLDGD